jgi:flagellar motor component MotA
MSKLARRFKKLTRLLFDLLMSNRLNSRNLLKWLEELLECSNAIRQESMFTLTKDSKWMKLHNRISDAISCLLKADHPFEDIVIDHDKKTVTVTFPAHGKTNTISGVS